MASAEQEQAPGSELPDLPVPSEAPDEAGDAGPKASQAQRVVATLIKNPIEGAQKVIEVLQARRGVAIGWAAGLLLGVLCYVLDLGAGSFWNSDDARVVLALQGMLGGGLDLGQASRSFPPPNGMPLALWQLYLMAKVLGPGEAALRLLPALSALGAAVCLLTISIDVGVGRHAGGLGGLVLLAMPLTYEISHRVLPDMQIGFIATLAVALWSHALHGHKFDRHILPQHKDAEEPAPLPLRRWPMALAAAGTFVAGLYSPRAALTALWFAVLDVLFAHRYLLLKRRVWAGGGAAAAATFLLMRIHPVPLRSWFQLPEPGVAMQSVRLLWHQGTTPYAAHAGQVVIVAAGFGLLLGSLRRASRPLLAWVLVALAMTGLGEIAEPPRGLGLVLPPLSLCAAVGLESPVRWLGRLGMVVSAAVLFGIVAVYAQADPVLHREDRAKALALSQRRAPADALLCTLGVDAALPTLYARRPVRQFNSAEEVRAALGKDQPLSCLLARDQVPALQEALLRAGNARELSLAPPAPPAPGQGAVKRRRLPIPPAPPARIESVLSTSLDIEEPPPDIYGPDVVLVSR